MIKTEYAARLERTGEDILDSAKRCIFYRTGSAEYLKGKMEDLNRMIVPKKVYRLSPPFNSQKRWREFIEEVLPEDHAIESMRDLC